MFSSFGNWIGVKGGESAQLREADALCYLNLQISGSTVVFLSARRVSGMPRTSAPRGV
jgi:hypothetical protein